MTAGNGVLILLSAFLSLEIVAPPVKELVYVQLVSAFEWQDNSVRAAVRAGLRARGAISSDLSSR